MPVLVDMIVTALKQKSTPKFESVETDMKYMDWFELL